jgi:hypothetical protein
LTLEQYEYRRIASYSKSQREAIRAYYAEQGILDLRAVVYELKGVGWTYSDILAIACRE